MCQINLIKVVRTEKSLFGFAHVVSFSKKPKTKRRVYVVTEVLADGVVIVASFTSLSGVIDA